MIEDPTVLPEDRLVCLGHGEPVSASGSMTPPIERTSLFAHDSLAALAEGFAAEHERSVYSRGNNPTVAALETKLARLERGEACRATASGMGAVSVALFGLLAAGRHALFVGHVYGPTLELAERLRSFGVEHDVVLARDPGTIGAALRPNTDLVWLESPGSLTFRSVDVAAIAQIAHARDARLVVDNSWATPLFQKPIELGADLVVHSVSKYVSGHSDLMAGALVGDGDLLERLFYDAYLLLGASLSPGDAWLVNRGLRTLPERMVRHHRDALAVARHLRRHPRVRRVLHPAFDDDADLVERQLTGYSGLFSIELDTESFDDVARFVDRLRLFRIGVSWGGTESLVIAANKGSNADDLRRREVPLGLVRLSIGLEGAESLIEDLDGALAADDGRGT